MSEQTLSIGTLLKNSREKSGRKQQDATRELNLSRTQLVALESDRFDALPGEPFVRGYIRLYAKWLELDVDAVIAQYLEQTGQQADMQPVAQKVARGALPLEEKSRFLAAGIAVAILVLLAWLYNDMTDDDVTPVAPVGQVDELQVDSMAPQRDADSAVEAAAAIVQAEEPVQEAENAAVEQAADTGNSGTVESVLEPQAAEPPVASVAQEEAVVDGLSIQQIEQEAIQEQQQADEALLAEAVATQQVEAVTEPVTGQDTLTLSFTADCWVEVRDASEKMVYSGMGKAGRVRQVAGQAPFEVLLGFARGASVQLNGEAFEFTPRANRNSMRLTVGKD